MFLEHGKKYFSGGVCNCKTKLSGKNNKTRNLFIFTVATTVSLLAYYELALNAQEKRKIRGCKSF